MFMYPNGQLVNIITFQVGSLLTICHSVLQVEVHLEICVNPSCNKITLSRDDFTGFGVFEPQGTLTSLTHGHLQYSLHHPQYVAFTFDCKIRVILNFQLAKNKCTNIVTSFISSNHQLDLLE